MLLSLQRRKKLLNDNNQYPVNFMVGVNFFTPFLSKGRGMKELIIFGRSPFINKLKLENIDYDRFDVCCINYPIPNIKVHYVVSADARVQPILAPKTEWISKNTGWDFKKTDRIIQEQGILSWCIYSSSLAVNFAITRGYKTMFLAGIDLFDDNKPFLHYDGVQNIKPASIDGTTKEKEYIKELANKFNVNIYQVNPDADWIETKDIGLL